MRKDRAMEFRRATQLAAIGASDAEAMTMPSVYPEWDGGGAAYAIGHIVRHGGGLYRCLTAHTSQAGWAPGTAPSLWVAISDPAEAWPAWVQPQGAHDAYKLGDHVSHGGKHWESTADANVWEPGAYGWKEVT